MLVVGRALSSDAGTDGEVRIISRDEKLLPGTEPHSPGTVGNGFDAPGNGRVTTGTVGIGTLNVPSARLGPQGVVRVSFVGEYLNIVNFPVRGATNIRSGITFAASIQPFSWGEIFVSYGAAANTNNRTSPNLIQALGDFSLGIKASNKWVKGFHAGVDVRLLTFSGVGNQSIDRFAFGVRPSLIAALDVRDFAAVVPIILNLALGFTFDGTGSLVTTQRLNASEEFALSTYRYNRFNLGLSLEVPLPWVMPFVEYTLAAPLGVPGGVLTGPDGATVPVGAVMPSQLGIGFKVTAIKDLTLLAGLQLGLARSVGLGIPATPPWNLNLGMAFAIDPFQRGETKIVETLKERKIEKKVAEAPKSGRVEGTVIDAATNKQLGNAVITLPGFASAATDSTGHFQSVELGTSQQVRAVVSRDGYKPVEQIVPLTPGKPTKIEVALQPDTKPSVLEIFVTAAKKPIAATVSLTGASASTVSQDANVTAPVPTNVPAGKYTATVTAEGHLSQTRDLQVGEGATMPLVFDLTPTPKKVLVVLKGDKIEILQQVHFATGKATILADSFQLLAQVVDVVVKNGVKRMRIEGHTDNRGVKAANQKLSEDRAAAVVDYLVGAGIDRSRLESVGYGDQRPVAPNLTAKGRELNRRVEFIITER